MYYTISLLPKKPLDFRGSAFLPFYLYSYGLLTCTTTSLVIDIFT